MKEKKQINKAAQAMGRLSHKKSPRSIEFLTEIGRKGAVVRWGKKKQENEA